LRQLERVLAPDGQAVFNIWSSRHLADQMRRIQRVLAIEGITEVHRNVVVRCRRRPFVTLLRDGR
jgi:hypothetical protein